MRFKQWFIESDIAMTGHALQQAIMGNPTDPTNWLVYADWLEENSKEREAKLIRLLLNKPDLAFYDILHHVDANNQGDLPARVKSALKKQFPFEYQQLIMHDSYLRSFLHIDRKNFRGLNLPFYRNGFYQDRHGVTWEVFSPSTNSMSAWLRLEHPNRRAVTLYDPGHSLRKLINQGRAYIPGVHSKEEATYIRGEH